MRINSFKVKTRDEFIPGERETIASHIRGCQYSIRWLRQKIANNTVDSVLAHKTIIELRKMIAKRREILGLRSWR